ncbi:MAG: YtxH domain-containing protein [Acidimicrobiia bacterium]
MRTLTARRSAAGIIVGLLLVLAPACSEETRDSIGNTASNVGEDTVEGLSDLNSVGQDLGSDARDAVDSVDSN